jgi:hypothetical protein
MPPSIFELFGRKSTGEPNNTPVAGSDPNNPNPSITPQTAPNSNPTVPSQTTPQSDGSIRAVPKVGEGDKSPLDGFKDLWKDDPSKKNNADQPSLLPTFNVDPAKLTEAVSKLDFASQLPQEMLTKALAGDASALTEALNSVARRTMSMSTEVMGQVVKDALTQQAQSFERLTPQILQRERINSHLDSTNPLFSNPAVKPMLDMARDRLIAQNPTASPGEIELKAREFIHGFAAESAKTLGMEIREVPKEQKNGRAKETNWDEWFGTAQQQSNIR